MIRLGEFCQRYAKEHGSVYHRIYASLRSAIMSERVRGKKEAGWWMVSEKQAERWLKTRGRRAATPSPKPIKVKFQMKPGDPLLQLFVDEQGRPLDPNDPMKGLYPSDGQQKGSDDDSERNQ